MNENAYTIRLRDFLTAGEGWGHKAGQAALKKLRQRLDNHPSSRLVRISLAEVRRLDVTCAGEVIVGLVHENRGTRAICLVDCADEDVLANVKAAAERTGVPVTLWHGAHVEVAGPAPNPALQAALVFAVARPQVRAAEFAKASGVSIASASNRFRQLRDEGYLMRSEGSAASGGAEYVYARIG